MASDSGPGLNQRRRVRREHEGVGMRLGTGVRSRLALALMLALAGCGKAPEKTAAAPPPPLVDAQIDPALQAMFAETQAPGMVVAIVRGDRVTIRGFGQRAPGDPKAPDGTTLVRLESVSKLLASDLMVTLAGQGKLKVADPLQAHAPAGRTVPVVKGFRPLELVDLATHTGGLPRTGPVDPMAPPDSATSIRWAWLAQHRLRPPGQAALYSNIGFDLLGDALSTAAKTSYPDALAKWVTGPAGMVDTTPTPSAAQCGRMMSGDAITSEPPCADTSASAASGGIYSTAADMAAWIRHELAGEGLDATARRAIYVWPASLQLPCGAWMWRGRRRGSASPGSSSRRRPPIRCCWKRPAAAGAS